MTETQQPKRPVLWKFYLEDESFGILSVLSFGLSVASLFLKMRLIVLAAVFVFALSIPHKDKIDLTIANLLFAALPVIVAVSIAYLFQPDNYS